MWSLGTKMEKKTDMYRITEPKNRLEKQEANDKKQIEQAKKGHRIFLC